MALWIPISLHSYTSPEVASTSFGPIAKAMPLDGIPCSTYFLNPIFYTPRVCISRRLRIFPMTDPLLASLKLTETAFYASRARPTSSFCSLGLSTVCEIFLELFLEVRDAKLIHAGGLLVGIGRGGGISTKARRLEKSLLENWPCHYVFPFSLSGRLILRIRLNFSRGGGFCEPIDGLKETVELF